MTKSLDPLEAARAELRDALSEAMRLRDLLGKARVERNTAQIRCSVVEASFGALVTATHRMLVARNTNARDEADALREITRLVEERRDDARLRSGQ